MNTLLKYAFLSMLFISGSLFANADAPSEAAIKTHDAEVKELQEALINKVNKKEQTVMKKLKKDKKNLVTQEAYEAAEKATKEAFEAMRSTVKYETNQRFHKKPFLRTMSGIF